MVYLGTKAATKEAIPLHMDSTALNYPVMKAHEKQRDLAQTELKPSPPD